MRLDHPPVQRSPAPYPTHPIRQAHLEAHPPRLAPLDSLNLLSAPLARAHLAALNHPRSGVRVVGQHSEEQEQAVDSARRDQAVVVSLGSRRRSNRNSSNSQMHSEAAGVCLASRRPQHLDVSLFFYYFARTTLMTMNSQRTRLGSSHSGFVQSALPGVSRARPNWQYIYDAALPIYLLHACVS